MRVTGQTPEGGVSAEAALILDGFSLLEGLS